MNSSINKKVTVTGRIVADPSPQIQNIPHPLGVSKEAKALVEAFKPKVS